MSSIPISRFQGGGSSLGSVSDPQLPVWSEGECFLPARARAADWGWWQAPADTGMVAGETPQAFRRGSEGSPWRCIRCRKQSLQEKKRGELKIPNARVGPKPNWLGPSSSVLEGQTSALHWPHLPYPIILLFSTLTVIRVKAFGMFQGILFLRGSGGNQVMSSFLYHLQRVRREESSLSSPLVSVPCPPVSKFLEAALCLSAVALLASCTCASQTESTLWK